MDDSYDDNTASFNNEVKTRAIQEAGKQLGFDLKLDRYEQAATSFKDWVESQDTLFPERHIFRDSRDIEDVNSIAATVKLHSLVSNPGDGRVLSTHDGPTRISSGGTVSGEFRDISSQGSVTVENPGPGLSSSEDYIRRHGYVTLGNKPIASRFQNFRECVARLMRPKLKPRYRRIEWRCVSLTALVLISKEESLTVSLM